MGSFGLLYRNVWIYRRIMRFLYGSEYARKYDVVVEEIPPGSRVVDLCCGDCRIAPALAGKKCTYLGLDANPAFVSWGMKHGLDVRPWNGKSDDIPEGDVICMQSSLYQFIPDDADIVRRMIAKALKKVVITEPIQNMTTGGSSFMSRLSKWMTRANGETFHRRHTEESLRKLFEPWPAAVLKPMGREMLIVLSKP